MHAPFPPVDVALRDGSTVRVRPVREDDQDGLRALLSELSPQSRWFRFFSTRPDVDKLARWAATGADGRGDGVVAMAGDPARIVGHAGYVRDGGGRAEIGFEVCERRQGQGIASVLLAHLAGAAAREGVQSFVATVHPGNHRMTGVLRASGFAVDGGGGGARGLLHFELPTALGADAVAAFEARDRTAARAAVAHVLRPASVARIGAPARPGSNGALHGEDVPGPVDLAVVDVPAPAVPEVARAYAAAGVRALVVRSGGLGSRLEAELLAACRAGGMRLVGPGAFGVLVPSLGLNATPAADLPASGRIAFAARSGAAGRAAIAEARRRGLGLSSLVSTGDTADLCLDDFLRFWAEDPETDVIALHVESLANPRRFREIARRVAAEKPIVAVTRPGDVLTDALLADTGVIRVDTVSEQFDVAARVLAGDRPVPAHATDPPLTGTDPDAVSALLANAADGWLEPPIVERLLRAYGLPLVAPALRIDIVADPGFGPVVRSGDVVRLAPLSRRGARAFPLLDEDVLVRVCALAADHPAIAELTWCPRDGARVRVAAPPAARPYPALDR